MTLEPFFKGYLLRYLLAFVHNLLLAAHLHRSQLLHVLLVVAEALGDLLVERIDQILQTAAEGLRKVVHMITNTAAGATAPVHATSILAGYETHIGQAEIQSALHGVAVGTDAAVNATNRVGIHAAILAHMGIANGVLQEPELAGSILGLAGRGSILQIEIEGVVEGVLIGNVVAAAPLVRLLELRQRSLEF